MISRKLMPRSSIFDPSGTDRSAITRIRSSCMASRCGRNATSLPSARPVRSPSSRAFAKLVDTFSGRRIVHSPRSVSGTCEAIPGFHGPGVESADDAGEIVFTVASTEHALQRWKTFHSTAELRVPLFPGDPCHAALPEVQADRPGACLRRTCRYAGASFPHRPRRARPPCRRSATCRNTERSPKTR